MNITDPELEAYIAKHTTPEPDVLRRLNRDTYANVMKPRMLSGHVQGRFLALISKMISPENILEIGTFTGYSAICLAEGLQENGRLYSIDVNEELKTMAESYFRDAGMEEKIVMLTGDAGEIIPTLDINFDLVFIDADKVSYPKYYELVMEKLKPGGFILADNVLWNGKVVEGGKGDKDTSAIIDFNKMVQEDQRTENVILSLRDGLMLVRKL